MKTSTKLWITALVLVFFVAPLGYYIKYENTPGKLDGFANCLKSKGVIFYGAYWCPHCQATKRMFGNSAKLLPYVECSLPNQGGQNQTCNDKGITGYPTWVFPDGSRLSGEHTLQELADKSSCTLPQ
jgi:thiol-disulfide isomerase/thioredoxin